MATITLNGNTLSGSLGVGFYTNIGTSWLNAKQSTGSLTTELGSLKVKIDVVCTVTSADTLSQSAQKAKEREETKKSALSLAYDKLDQFIADVAVVDGKVATKVEKLKDDFYSKYSYLRPDCEKSDWEKFKENVGKLWDGLCNIGNAIKDFVGGVVEWCKEHWKELLIGLALIVVGALITVFTAGTGTAFWAAFGAALVKGLAMATVSAFVGGFGDAATKFATAILSGASFGEAFSQAIDAFGDGFATGFLMGSFGFLGGSLGAVFGNSYKGFKVIQTISKVSGKVSNVMEKVSTISDLVQAVLPNTDMAKFCKSITSNPVFETVSGIAEITSVCSGGAYKTAEITDGSYKNADGSLKSDVKYKTDDGYHCTTDSKGRLSSGQFTQLELTKFDLDINDNMSMKGFQAKFVNMKVDFKYDGDSMIPSSFTATAFKFDFTKIKINLNLVGLPG